MISPTKLSIIWCNRKKQWILALMLILIGQHRLCRRVWRCKDLKLKFKHQMSTYLPKKQLCQCMNLSKKLEDLAINNKIKNTVAHKNNKQHFIIFDDVMWMMIWYDNNNNQQQHNNNTTRWILIIIMKRRSNLSVSWNTKLYIDPILPKCGGYTHRDFILHSLQIRSSIRTSIKRLQNDTNSAVKELYVAVCQPRSRSRSWVFGPANRLPNAPAPFSGRRTAKCRRKRHGYSWCLRPSPPQALLWRLCWA